MTLSSLAQTPSLGSCLLERDITGTIGTNSSGKEWRSDLEREFSRVSSSSTRGSNLAVLLEFWIDKNRLTGNRLDSDNLAKPVLDSMKKAGIIYDDSLIDCLLVIKHRTSSQEHLEVSIWEWVN